MGGSLRLVSVALAIFTSLCVEQAAAQSIEETYASLCKTDEQKQGESCVALRKALLEKLQAESGSPPVARTRQVASAPPVTPPAQAMDPAAIRAKWGIFADLAGRAWVSKLAGYRTIEIFEWETPGEVLLFHIAGLNTDETILTPPSTTKINAEALELAFGKVMADGTLVNQMYSDALKTDLRTTHRLNSGTYEQVTERLKGGKWRHYITSKYQQVPLSGPPTMRSAIAHFQGPSGGSKGSGGLLGALGGAALGAIAGGNTEQIVGAAMKGAAMVDPNAAALDAVGDSLIGGNTASLASAGGLSGASNGGSFPARPNALDGSAACSMMNQGNYRDVSLSGGNDVQLKTMCGQAFEYYTMYLRAIEQGYSEADANRTYDAHQQAALNAISFYENNR